MAAASVLTKVKPFHELPLKRGLLPVLFELLVDGGPNYLHNHFEKRHQKLGPIFRYNLGGKEFVSVSDVKMMQSVFANEGQHPINVIPDAWSLYNKQKNLERGLFFRAGESWLKMRKVFNKIFLNSDRVNQFGPDIADITRDLFQFWKHKHNQSGIDVVNETEFSLENCEPDLCRWSVEAIGYILFGARLGAIAPDGQTDHRAQVFTQQVFGMLRASSKLQTLPAELAQKLNLKSWRDFCKTSDDMIRIANEYVEDNLQLQKRDGTYKGLIGDMFQSGELDEVDIRRSVVDFVIAAADTTAASINWCLYLLATHPEVQEKILKELKQFARLEGGQLELSNIDEKAIYLKAFVREATRLYPAAPFLSRVVPNAMNLGGYQIPAGMTIILPLITASRRAEYFSQPDTLKPERWIRSATGKFDDDRVHQPLASIPFGMGSRMCIGRKMANLEMNTFIACFVDEFEVALVNRDEETNVKLNMTTWTEKPIKFSLKTRSG